MPVGGVADQILVKEGDRVKVGQVLMKLDTEASEENRISLEKTIKLKQEQLTLKEEEKRNTMQVNQEEVLMLESNLQLQIEILERMSSWRLLVLFRKCSTSISKTSLLKRVEN